MLAAMAVALAPHGAAHAYPIKDKRLTHNRLYKSGPLPQRACAEKPVRPATTGWCGHTSTASSTASTPPGPPT